MESRGLCADVTGAVERYLGLVDRLLPGRVTGFYLVGSVALGDHRPGRSDVDFVGVVDGDLDRGDLRRLRLVHALSAARTAAGALAGGSVGAPGAANSLPSRVADLARLTLAGVCNGVYVRAAELSWPVSRIAPVASHTGASFAVGRGFDVNPVQWTTFAARGVAVRGPEPASLGLDPEPATMRRWNLDNLASYWVPWAGALRRRPDVRYRSHPRWWTSRGVLGAPRLHHTVATGGVISKAAAADHARAAFDARWHPLIDEALAYRRAEPADLRYRDVRVRAAATAEFVLDVARAAAAH